MIGQTSSTPDPLEDYVSAIRDQIDATEISAAAKQLRERWPTMAADRERTFPRLAWVAGLVAAVAVVILPMFSPVGGGVAFAQVQRWFEDYESLRLTMTTEQGGATVSRMEVLSSASGKTRVETQGATLIIDAVNGEIITLLSGSRYVTQPIETMRAGSAKSFEWLQDIRRFEGVAEPLADSRVIGHELATGFHLSVSGVDTTLWVNATDGRPIELELDLEGDVRMLGRFEFDAALPDDAFAVPSDYVPMEL